MPAGMFWTIVSYFLTSIDFNDPLEILFDLEKKQVYTEVSSLIELCRVQLKAVQLTSSMPASDMVSVTSFIMIMLSSYDSV